MEKKVQHDEEIISAAKAAHADHFIKNSYLMDMIQY